MKIRQFNPTVIALYAIVALLLANLIATFSRSDAPAILPSALGQRQAPIAGGGGVFIMPAQLTPSIWGCYLLDVDRGTISVYKYYDGKTQLQFVAARNFTNDTRLENYNTDPPPRDIAELVAKQNLGARTGAVPPPPADTTRKDDK
jgi:hypothetical protein